MKKLAIIDDTLEELGTPKIYRDMHMWSKRVIIGWIVYIITINFYDSWSNDINCMFYKKLILINILNHCFHVNLFVYLLFIIFLWFVYNIYSIYLYKREIITYLLTFVYIYRCIFVDTIMEYKHHNLKNSYQNFQNFILFPLL